MTCVASGSRGADARRQAHNFVHSLNLRVGWIEHQCALCATNGIVAGILQNVRRNVRLCTLHLDMGRKIFLNWNALKSMIKHISPRYTILSRAILLVATTCLACGSPSTALEERIRACSFTLSTAFGESMCPSSGLWLTISVAVSRF